MSFGDFKINVPQFAGNCYNYNAAEKTLNYTLALTKSNSLNENPVQISNLVYEPISKLQIGDLDPEKIPKHQWLW